MKERPILFSTEMVKAILEGRKTQTRRVCKSTISTSDHGMGHSPMVLKEGYWYRPIEYNPYGQPGDRLWVRETWHQHSSDDDFCTGEIHYRATEICVGTKWIPSIFMPRWASRITLEVVNIRVERVLDISEEDALAEGCVGLPCNHSGQYGTPWACTDCMNTGWIEPPSLDYMLLWNTINAKRGYGWDVNPWVWVISFKRVE